MMVEAPLPNRTQPTNQPQYLSVGPPLKALVWVWESFGARPPSFFLDGFYSAVLAAIAAVVVIGRLCSGL